MIITSDYPFNAEQQWKPRQEGTSKSYQMEGTNITLCVWNLGLDCPKLYTAFQDQHGWRWETRGLGWSLKEVDMPGFADWEFTLDSENQPSRICFVIDSFSDAAPGVGLRGSVEGEVVEYVEVVDVHALHSKENHSASWQSGIGPPSSGKNVLLLAVGRGDLLLKHPSNRTEKKHSATEISLSARLVKALVLGLTFLHFHLAAGAPIQYPLRWYLIWFNDIRSDSVTDVSDLPRYHQISAELKSTSNYSWSTPSEALLPTAAPRA